MDSHDIERAARIARAAVGLGVSLALLPVRLALRALRPPQPPDDARWAPVDDVAAPPEPELRVEEPWPGYDDMTVAQVGERLDGADPALKALVRAYEAAHKGRKGVLRATE